MKAESNRLLARLTAAAEEEIEHLLKDMPGELSARAREVPVSIEALPTRAMMEEGLDPDLLGLFEGRVAAEEIQSLELRPAHIYLFVFNLWDEAGADMPTYREEVRRTYLHELGHYLGLDEGDLEQRDLD